MRHNQKDRLADEKCMKKKKKKNKAKRKIKSGEHWMQIKCIASVHKTVANPKEKKNQNKIIFTMDVW